MSDSQQAGGDAAGDMDDIFSSDRDRGADLAAPEDSGGVPRDELGRFAPREEPEQQTAPEPEAQPEPQEAPSQQPADDHRVPVSALTAERQKFQSRIDELQRQMQERDAYYAQMLQAQQQPHQQQTNEPPDFFEDPDAAFESRFQHYLNPVMQQMERMQHAHLNSLETIARGTYGDEKINAAIQAAQAAGIARQFADQPDPYGSLVAWHNNVSFLERTGGDIDAYEQRREQEIRAKVLQELKAGGGQSQPHLPTTLADRTNAGMGVQGQVHPEAMMNDMFNPSRDRRQG